MIFSFAKWFYTSKPINSILENEEIIMKNRLIILLACTSSIVFAGNQKLKQGEATVTINGNTQTWLSQATVLGKNLGKQVQKALNSPQGDAIKQQAKSKVKQVIPNSGDVKVKNSDAVDFAKDLEGKTLYASQAMSLGNELYVSLSFMNKGQQFNINVKLKQSLDPSTAVVESVMLVPEYSDPFKAYQAQSVSGKIESIKNVGDKAIALSGTLTATGLEYMDTMKKKKLSGKADIQTLSATFNLHFIPVKK